MGIHNLASNSKRSVQDRKCYKKSRMKRKIKFLKHGGKPKVAEILDPELMTIHHLKRRRTCPRANITLSGKKKRKLMKRLRHAAKERSQMDGVKDDEEVEKPKPAKKDKDVTMTLVPDDDDVDMEEGETSSTKTKKKKNKKKKKKNAKTEDTDTWEDMEEVG